MKRRSCYRSQVWWGWALSIRRSPWKPWKLDLLEKEKKEKKKKKWGLATLLLLMNVHIVTMYVSWFVVHCDKCMVNIALQHCKSYLLNLICRCVWVCVCVCVRACVCVWNGKKNNNKKKKNSRMRLCWSTSQQAYLWICVTVDHYYNTQYVTDLNWRWMSYWIISMGTKRCHSTYEGDMEGFRLRSITQHITCATLLEIFCFMNHILHCAKNYFQQPCRNSQSCKVSFFFFFFFFLLL